MVHLATTLSSNINIDSDSVITPAINTFYIVVEIDFDIDVVKSCQLNVVNDNYNCKQQSTATMTTLTISKQDEFLTTTIALPSTTSMQNNKSNYDDDNYFETSTSTTFSSTAIVEEKNNSGFFCEFYSF